jgi:hypothetical protein
LPNASKLWPVSPPTSSSVHAGKENLTDLYLIRTVTPWD